MADRAPLVRDRSEYERLYKWSIDDPQDFWASMAQDYFWAKKVCLCAGKGELQDGSIQQRRGTCVGLGGEELPGKGEGSLRCAARCVYSTLCSMTH
jgi:hypothetical protein